MVSSGEKKVRVIGAVLVVLILSLITVEAFRGRGKHSFIRQKPAWKHRPGDMLVAFDITAADDGSIGALKVKLDEEGFESIAKKTFDKGEGPRDYLIVKGPVDSRALLPAISEATGFKAIGLGSKKDIGFARKGKRERYVKLMVPKENMDAFVEGATAANATATVEDGYVLVVVKMGEGADGGKLRELIGSQNGIPLTSGERCASRARKR